MTECYEEFTELFAYYKSLNEEAIFCGDYNFHMNQPDDDKAKKFKDILETFELKQHVCDSTNKEGNTLDLLIKDSRIQGFKCFYLAIITLQVLYIDS